MSMGRLEGRTTGWIGIWIEWNGIQIRCLHKISKTGEFAFLIGSPSFVASAGLVVVLVDHRHSGIEESVREE